MVASHWGSESTIFVDSTVTVVPFFMRSSMQVGSSRSPHQSLGSLTIPEALSVLTS